MFGLSKTVNITVKGMHCPHCEMTVSKAAAAVSGVTSAKACAKKNLLVVKVKDMSVITAVKKAVKETDFEVE